MKTFQKALLLGGLATAASFVSLSPAHALTGCAGGTTGFLLASELAAFGTGGTVTEWIIGDKKYSNFSYSSVGGNGVQGNDAFNFAQLTTGTGYHNLNVQSATTFFNTTVSLSYTIEGFVPWLVLNSYSSNVTGDIGTLWAQRLTGNGGTSNTTGYPALAQDATTPYVDFVSGTSTDTLTTTLIAGNTGVGVNQFANRVTQAPGPLAILGAGTAFGFSRKLRNRIKSVA